MKTVEYMLEDKTRMVETSQLLSEIKSISVKMANGSKTLSDFHYIDVETRGAHKTPEISAVENERKLDVTQNPNRANRFGPLGCSDPLCGPSRKYS